LVTRYKKSILALSSFSTTQKYCKSYYLPSFRQHVCKGEKDLIYLNTSAEDSDIDICHRNPNDSPTKTLIYGRPTLLGLNGKFTPAVLMFCQRIDFNIDRTPIQFFSVFTGLPIATHSLPPPSPYTHRSKLLISFDLQLFAFSRSLLSSMIVSPTNLKRN